MSQSTWSRAEMKMKMTWNTRDIKMIHTPSYYKHNIRVTHITILLLLLLLIIIIIIV
jgi:hypothetical protein